jgi:2-polyprenyl-6-methoxyphenol hydroxylase-like FAD-dependent oxidoreductase
MSGSLGNTEDQVATPKEKTVIIGAGPTGLLVALYMCQRGHNVVLIEKRENYTSRENALIQQFHAIQLLLKDFTNFYQCGYQINFVLTGDQINIDVTFDPNKITDPHAKMDEIDIKFIESLRQAHDDVATNAFQKYIQSKITSLKNNHSFEIVTQAQAVSANEATNSIHYIDGNTTEYVELGFNNLIVCEGTQRKFTQKVISTDTVSVMQSPDDVTCAHGVGFIDVPPELIKNFMNFKQKNHSPV